MQIRKMWSSDEIDCDLITATDLQREIPVANIENSHDVCCYLINIEGSVEKAQAVHIDGRLGIAWGADAAWADVDDVESGIEMWLNNPDEWEKRN